jgi:Zn-dependent M16 (insulinase) family peptidase
LTFRLNEDAFYKTLLTKGPQFWVSLLRDYVDLNKPNVVIKGRPSPKVKAQLAEEEKQRVAERKEILGTRGMQEKKRELDAAIAANEVTIYR